MNPPTKSRSLVASKLFCVMSAKSSSEEIHKRVCKQQVLQKSGVHFTWPTATHNIYYQTNNIYDFLLSDVSITLIILSPFAMKWRSTLKGLPAKAPLKDTNNTETEMNTPLVFLFLASNSRCYIANLHTCIRNSHRPAKGQHIDSGQKFIKSLGVSL